MTEIELLRKMYDDDLSKLVNYRGNNPRSRVAHPMKYTRQPTIVRLDESVDTPLQIDDNNIDKVFVWSDTHFFHKNIISFSRRPYENTVEMNENLIDNYNEYVGDDGIGIWVGDIGFKGNTAINALLDRCKGYKILVVGNHDYNKKNIRHLNFDETHMLYHLDISDTSLVFTHYPMDNIIEPWFNVHGHLHAYPVSCTGNPLHYNVNCELHNYRPIELAKVIEIVKQRMINIQRLNETNE